MKLYIVHIYPPDMNEGDDNFFGVFDSKKKYMEALKNFGEEIDFDFEEGTYEVTETLLNEANH